MIGDFSILRPWRTWLKVSAFFRRPATEWHFGRWRGGGRGLRFHAPWWRIIQFSAVDIVYRKCDDRRYAVESLPQYNILLLNRWLLQVRLVAPNKAEDAVFSLDDLYWETVIDVANGSLLREAVESNTWKLCVGSGEDASLIHRSNAKTEGFLTDDAMSFV